jgi:penicillin-binding protein 2
LTSEVLVDDHSFALKLSHACFSTRPISLSSLLGYDTNVNRSNRNPLAPLALFITVILALFVARLAWLQIVLHDEFSTQSSDNHFSPTTLRALRGEILANDGKTILATSRVAVDLIYKGVRKGGTVRFWDKIARLIGANPSEGLPSLARGQETILKKNLSEDKIYPIAEWISSQKMFELRLRTERNYPEGIDGNLLGYTRPADDRPEDKLIGYTTDDLVGTKGLEAGLEPILRGNNGMRYLEVDAGGHMIGERVQQEAQRGKNVTLTIDLNLQRAAEKALLEGVTDINRMNTRNGVPLVQKARGAIVALRPSTGEILALATAPHFDPNWFSTRPRPIEASKAMNDNVYLPTWNRAVRIFEPGSTFKLVTASTLLESPFGNRSYSCVTNLRYGGRTKWNWNHMRNMGMLDARGAIAQSCNTWYWQAAIQYGPEGLANAVAERAAEFGFGEPTGIEMIGEQTEPVPSPERYKSLGKVWYPGMSLDLTIGQQLRSTPLQVARMLATIVNSGRRPELTLVKSIDGQAAPVKPSVQLSGTKWSMLKEGMQWTVSRGTAVDVLGPREFPIVTAGKTGTAQTGQGRNRDHAWYMGYGPVDKPDLVVVAFFQNGVEGHGAALPAVKKVMAAYWKVPLDKNGKWVKGNAP